MSKTGNPVPWVGPLSGGNYLVQVQAFIQAHGDKLRGGYVMKVRHDNWRGVFLSRPCNCQPEFVLQRVVALTQI